ncbi:MAG TPA: PASTA domain-containing protein [Gemmatimonadaceae bacterium]|nr:PASTA domain-containing protein [Gemmatimonadaceae bacterium]
MSGRALGRRAFPYLLVSVFGFLLAYILLFLFAFPAEVLPDDGKVPNVVGVSFDDASAALNKAGFHAVQGETRFHRSVAEGIVLQQDPPAGSTQKRGSDITLAVSGGQKSAVVPDVAGLSQQQARLMIENAGFQFGSISQQVSDQPRGAVIGSNPAAGQSLPLPAVVAIAISNGPASLQVPDLTGRTVADARSTLEQLGLHLGDVSRDTSSFQPENTVLGQSPGPGQMIGAGGRVNLRISRFPPIPSMPRIDTGGVER